MRERGKELWEGIKTEVLYSSDTSVEAAGFKALEALIYTLYPTAADVPSGLAQDIIKQGLEYMEDPEKSQAVAATKTLAALVRASRESTYIRSWDHADDLCIASAGPYALSQVLPHLFKSFNRPILPSHRSSSLSAITSLLAAAQSVYCKLGATRRQADERSLSTYRENLMHVVREGLRTSGMKVTAASGSLSLVEIPGLIGRDEVEDLVRGLNDSLINDADTEVQ